MAAREDCRTDLLDTARTDMCSVPRSTSVYFLVSFHGQSLVRCIAGSCRFSGLDMPWRRELRDGVADNR